MSCCAVRKEGMEEREVVRSTAAERRVRVEMKRSL